MPGPKRLPGGGAAKEEEIILELKANGEGLWRVGSEDVFSEIPAVWYIRHGELRINTRARGVIVGKIGKDTVQITLPTFGPLTFRKTQ
jgi:hypothetical protein